MTAAQYVDLVRDAAPWFFSHVSDYGGRPITAWIHCKGDYGMSLTANNAYSIPPDTIICASLAPESNTEEAIVRVLLARLVTTIRGQTQHTDDGFTARLGDATYWAYTEAEARDGLLDSLLAEAA